MLTVDALTPSERSRLASLLREYASLSARMAELSLERDRIVAEVDACSSRIEAARDAEKALLEEISARVGAAVDGIELPTDFGWAVEPGGG